MKAEINSKAGRVYAIQCGAEDYVIVQFGLPKLDTVGVFEGTVSARDVEQLRSIVAQSLSEQTVLLHLMLDRAPERRGKWIYVGRFPLHKEIDAGVEFVSIGTKSSEDGRELSFEYTAFSLKNPHGRRVSREEAIGLEYELTPGPNVFWRWVCRSKAVPFDERSPSIFRKHLRDIWADPVRRKQVEWQMPGFLAQEAERLGVRLE